jgi:hypothetical protein
MCSFYTTRRGAAGRARPLHASRAWHPACEAAYMTPPASRQPVLRRRAATRAAPLYRDATHLVSRSGPGVAALLLASALAARGGAPA